MTDQLPVIDGREAVILHTRDYGHGDPQGWYIADVGVQCELRRDGQWHRGFDVSNLPFSTREAALEFLRSLAPPVAVKERLTSEDKPGWYECYELPYSRLGSVVHWDGKWLHRDNLGLYGLEMRNYTKFRGPLVPQQKENT